MLDGSFLMGFLGTGRWDISVCEGIQEGRELTATGHLESRHPGCPMVFCVGEAGDRLQDMNFRAWGGFERCRTLLLAINVGSQYIPDFSFQSF